MKKAKAAWFFAGGVLFLVSVIFVFGNQIIFYAVRYGLTRALPEYEVSFKTALLRPDSLTLYGTKAKNKEMSLDAGETKIFFKPLELIQGRVSGITVRNMTADVRGILVKDIEMDFDGRNEGRLSAESVSYKKFIITSLQSPFRLEGKTLTFEPIRGLTLDGSLEGRFQAQLEGDKAYDLELTLHQLSLPALISDLKFEDKMSMSGRFLGNISVRGDHLGVQVIDGVLSGSDQGGDLVILDEAFLGNIATRMKQPLELVKAGLKEYHYDSGQARLLKNGRDLGLDLSLNGPKGKRQLSTVFHDTV